MSIVQTALHRHKLRQERHWPGTLELSLSPLIARQTCRSCRSLDGVRGSRLLSTCHSYGVALPRPYSTGISEEPKELL